MCNCAMHIVHMHVHCACAVVHVVRKYACPPLRCCDILLRNTHTKYRNAIFLRGNLSEFAYMCKTIFAGILEIQR